MSFSAASPTSQFQRVIFFIDGKNLALRYKEIKERNRERKTPYPQVNEIQDSFVWIPPRMNYPSTTLETPQKYQLKRAYYFTYLTGDESAYKETLSKICSLPACKDLQVHLSPRVHKKLNSERSSKGDDISLAVTAMHHAYSGHLDIAHFFTGDGDFIPLIQEIKNLGIYVAVSSFSEGLNDALKMEADFFEELDKLYFQDLPQRSSSSN